MNQSIAIDESPSGPLNILLCGCGLSSLQARAELAEVCLSKRGPMRLRVLYAVCLSLLLLLVISNIYLQPVHSRPLRTSARPAEAPVAPVVAATWRLRDQAGAAGDQMWRDPLPPGDSTEPRGPRPAARQVATGRRRRDPSLATGTTRGDSTLPPDESSPHELCPLPPEDSTRDTEPDGNATSAPRRNSSLSRWRERARSRQRTRYLAFQPQGGLSNQLVALAHAAAWALVLDRTLVLPHLLPHQDLSAARRNDSVS